MKAVSWWQDQGLSEYSLYFLRTKDKREVVKAHPELYETAYSLDLLLAEKKGFFAV